MIKDIILEALLIQVAASAVISYKSYEAVKELKVKINKSIGAVEELKGKVHNTEKTLKNELRNEIRKQFYHIAFIRFRP